MICPYCNKNEATLSFSKTIYGQAVTINICESCYKELQARLESLSSALGGAFGGALSQVLGGQAPSIGKFGSIREVSAFPEQKFDVGSVPEHVQSATQMNERIGYFKKIVIQPNCVFLPNKVNKTCSCCGVTLQNFLLQFDRGCAICFSEFKDEIVEYANTLQLRKELIDKEAEQQNHCSDAVTKEQLDELAKLEQQKADAIAKKDWNAAAECRDRINALRVSGCDSGEETDAEDEKG